MADAVMIYKWDPRSGGRQWQAGDWVYVQVVYRSDAQNAFSIKGGQLDANGEIVYTNTTRNTWAGVVNLFANYGITLPSSPPVPGY